MVYERIKECGEKSKLDPTKDEESRCKKISLEL